MSHILVYRYIDIINNTDYDRLYKTVEKKFNGICPNFGNKLWYQGIISEITVDGNSIDFYNPSMDIALINEKYDLVLYPMANIFSLDYAHGLPNITMFVKKLRIPIFIISCGVQAKSYNELDSLVKSIGEVSKAFIQAVYDSGGEFALRGYFTAEFFSRLGFKNPAVVGCPSLFQTGKDLIISNDKVSLKDFKINVNGVAEIAIPIMKKYNSIFYDQEAFYDFMYNKEYYDGEKLNLYNNLKWIKSSGLGMNIVDWINQERIRLLADMWDWQHSIQNEDISFSYGTRIHGNIMSILSGVPALIVNIDARVKEMAEFYEIPNIDYQQAMKIKERGNDIYNLYLNTDYSKFNQHYIKKYEAFRKFLLKCGIIQNSMNENNPYLNCSDGKYPTSAAAASKHRAEIIQKRRWLYDIILKSI